LHIAHTEWHVKPDVNQKDMEESRARIFEEAAQQNMLVFANHFDFPGLGRITKEEKKFTWQVLK